MAHDGSSSVQFDLGDQSTESSALLHQRRSNATAYSRPERGKSILNFMNNNNGPMTEEEQRQRKKEQREHQARMRRQSVFALDDGPQLHNRKKSIKAQRHDHHARRRQSGRDPKAPTEYKRDVEYDGENHMGVLFQLYGSVWPAVLPWCLIILFETAAVWYLREHKIVDLTIASNTGHSFMSILVSFLIVTRTTITYNRFMEARQHLADLYRSSREIVHYTCVMTNQNMSQLAKDWRQEVAYRTIVTLRVAVAALEYRSKGVNTWDVIPVEEHERTELMVEHHDSTVVEELHGGNNGGGNNGGSARSDGSGGGSNRNVLRNSLASEYKPETDHFAVLKSLAHGPRTRTDENFRAPIVWAYNLREAILWPRKSNSKILAERPWHVNESLKLMALVSDFVAAYHELKKLVSTPFPFPLIQMTRTFLFFWVFTLPMVLAEDNDQPYEVFVLMFFITYGFLGLEYVNMELDDPYGNDPNDFPGQRWAETVFEDIYIAIYKTDGYNSAVALRSRISERTARGAPLQLYRDEVGNNDFRWAKGLKQVKEQQEAKRRQQQQASQQQQNGGGSSSSGVQGGGTTTMLPTINSGDETDPLSSARQGNGMKG